MAEKDRKYLVLGCIPPHVEHGLRDDALAIKDLSKNFYANALTPSKGAFHFVEIENRKDVENIVRESIRTICDRMSDCIDDKNAFYKLTIKWAKKYVKLEDYVYIFDACDSEYVVLVDKNMPADKIYGRLCRYANAGNIKLTKRNLSLIMDIVDKLEPNMRVEFLEKFKSDMADQLKDLDLTKDHLERMRRVYNREAKEYRKMQSALDEYLATLPDDLRLLYEMGVNK